MPEWPEVEQIRRELAVLEGRRIAGVTVLCERTIRTPADPEEFAARLAGETWQEIGRRGKYLLFHGLRWTLISHLRMEGRYRLVEAKTPVDEYTRVIFIWRTAGIFATGMFANSGRWTRWSAGSGKRFDPLLPWVPNPSIRS